MFFLNEFWENLAVDGMHVHSQKPVNDSFAKEKNRVTRFNWAKRFECFFTACLVGACYTFSDRKFKFFIFQLAGVYHVSVHEKEVRKR